MAVNDNGPGASVALDGRLAQAVGEFGMRWFSPCAGPGATGEAARAVLAPPGRAARE
jgi:hypothetical protein